MARRYTTVQTRAGRNSWPRARTQGQHCVSGAMNERSVVVYSPSRYLSPAMVGAGRSGGFGNVCFCDVDSLPATGALISVESLPAFPPRMRKSDFGSRKIIILP